MDVVRSVLGDDQLTYLGFSYGTRLGYTYAELFPENVRAMVLDGALDPAANAADEVVAQGAGFQSVFDAFAADCAGRSDCPLGTDPAELCVPSGPWSIRWWTGPRAPSSPGRRVPAR